MSLRIYPYLAIHLAIDRWRTPRLWVNGSGVLVVGLDLGFLTGYVMIGIENGIQNFAIPKYPART